MAPAALTTSVEIVCWDVVEKGEAAAGASELASHRKEKQPVLGPAAECGRVVGAFPAPPVQKPED